MSIKGVGPGGNPQPEKVRTENAGQVQHSRHPGESSARRSAEVGARSRGGRRPYTILHSIPWGTMFTK